MLGEGSEQVREIRTVYQAALRAGGRAPPVVLNEMPADKRTPFLNP